MDKFKKWLIAAGIRALKTFAQAFAGGITVGVALDEINWTYLTSTAAVSAIYSIVTSIAGLPELKEGEENA